MEIECRKSLHNYSVDYFKRCAKPMLFLCARMCVCMYVYECMYVCMYVLCMLMYVYLMDVMQYNHMTVT